MQAIPTVIETENTYEDEDDDTKNTSHYVTDSEEEKEDVDTIGGFVAKTLGRVPIPGSTILLHDWQITAERPVGRRHRIATFLVEKSAANNAVKEV